MPFMSSLFIMGDKKPHVVSMVTESPKSRAKFLFAM